MSSAYNGGSKMAADSSHTPWTSRVMPVCSGDFLVSSTARIVQASRTANKPTSCSVIVVTAAEIATAVSATTMTVSTYARTQGGSDQTGQVLIAVIRRQQRRTTPISASSYGPESRCLPSGPYNDCPALSGAGSANREIPTT